MQPSRDDFVIAVRSAFLKKENKQKKRKPIIHWLAGQPARPIRLHGQNWAPKMTIFHWFYKVLRHGGKPGDSY